jgi:DNA-binding Lrp family transcriptional regulator
VRRTGNQEQIGLSASAVKRRVDRLVADGVIRGFMIQVGPAVDGMATEANGELFWRGIRRD